MCCDGRAVGCGRTRVQRAKARGVVGVVATVGNFRVLWLTFQLPAAFEAGNA